MYTTMSSNNSPISPKFYCELCNIKTNNYKDYKNHVLTKKHRLKENEQPLAPVEETVIPPTVKCTICEKEYESRSGLWRHKKTCILELQHSPAVTGQETTSNNDLIHLLIKENSDFKSMIMELVKSNTELQKQMLEVCKNNNQPGTSNTTTTINSNNKTTFNMQVFLNETCKDAMNLKDFVDSIQLTLADFEMVGKKGIVDGISNIIVGNLNATDMCLRPIHCSDAKREVMYVKENDKWEKDGPRNDKVRHVVQNVEHKNIRLLVDYCKEHPDCMDPDSPENDNYLHMSSVATSGTDDHLDKIISRIAKEVLIDK